MEHPFGTPAGLGTYIPSDNRDVSTTRPTKRLSAAKAEDLAAAAIILREGGLVAFPTETVYGLGANAFSADAVSGIFQAKQRPHWDPLIVHLADRQSLPRIASTSPLAEKLMDAFWPGPLTLLLPRTSAVPDAVTAGRPLVGVRIPAHPDAQSLLFAAGIPLAAPSANRFGHTSPTLAAHVLADLDGRIDAVLDGGPTEVGVESTVAEVHGESQIVIYRHGVVTFGMLESIAGLGNVRAHHAEITDTAPESLPSPGVGIRHYAPHARLILVRDDAAPGRTPIELSLVHSIQTFAGSSERVGVMLPLGWNPASANVVFPWGKWDEPRKLAQRLFAGLRELDDEGCTLILCPLPSASGIGDALRDRLEKAARTN